MNNNLNIVKVVYVDVDNILKNIWTFENKFN